jgi:hypothetical protein
MAVMETILMLSGTSFSRMRLKMTAYMVFTGEVGWGEM